jgi:hypothetical protein
MSAAWFVCPAGPPDVTEGLIDVKFVPLPEWQIRIRSPGTNGSA